MGPTTGSTTSGLKPDLNQTRGDPLPSSPAFTIPADFIAFDDTVSGLGMTDLQVIIQSLAARLASLEALTAPDAMLDFSDPGQSALEPGI